MALTNYEDMNYVVKIEVHEEIDINSLVAEKLKTVRIKLGYSLNKFAKKIYSTPTKVKKYELGVIEIPFSYLIQIQVYIGIKVGYFFERYRKYINCT